MAQLVLNLLLHTEGKWHETKISGLILLCFLMQQCDFIIFTTTLEGSRETCALEVLHLLLLLSKLLSFLCFFSKLAIAFWFRTWANALVVFVFKWWCFFLGIIQRWLFWRELQWIILSENMRGDLPNFRWAQRPGNLLPLIDSWLNWGEILWLI